MSNEPITDDELRFLAELFKRMSAGPWKVNTDKSKVGENWSLAWCTGYGQTHGDDAGRDYYIEVTTDGVNCSRLGGGAMEDATGIVALRNMAPRIVRRLVDAEEQLTDLVQRVRTFCDDRIREAADEKDRCGVAGSWEERTKAAVCEDILKLLGCAS